MALDTKQELTVTGAQAVVSPFSSLLNPLNPTIKIEIVICCPFSSPAGVVGGKLIKYQANSSCVIKSVILMTPLFYKALIFARRNFMLITLRA